MMTEFEKNLLRGYLETTFALSEMSRTILESLRAEDTGHIGDEQESQLVGIIQLYLEELAGGDQYDDQINTLIEETIIPQIAAGNYETVIDALEKARCSITHKAW